MAPLRVPVHLCLDSLCSVVSQVRDLLHRMEQGPDPQRAKEQLEELFSLEAEKGVSRLVLRAVCR